MMGFGPLLKKEIVEQLRTHRLLIVGVIFLFFGLTTPLLLYYMPEIMQMAGVANSIEIPQATAAESMAEFASTIAQIGLLVIILTAMGTIANEYKHGTAYLTLSKPVSRLAFVTAKFTAGALTMLVSLIVSALICYAYSVWLIGPLAFSGFLMQTGLTALFLLFVLALTVFFSSIFKNSLAAGGLSLGVIILLALIASLPKIGNYLPGKLTGWSLDVLDGVSTPYWWALGITVVLIVLAVYFAQMILKKREA